MIWQTMESAPTDGTGFLAYAKDYLGNDCIAVIYFSAMSWRLCEHNNSDYGDGWDESPTHWMPLPNKPE